MLLKRLKKSKSLRIVNLLGLIAIFSCLLLSYAFIRKELSYDRFHEKADRIVRLSTQWDNEPVDGRNWGFSKDDPFITGIAGLEDVVLMDKVNTGVMVYNAKPRIVNEFYFASSNFFEVFSFPLLQGEKSQVLDAPEKAVISKTYAMQLFGEEPAVGKEIRLSGRKFTDKTLFISGVFEDFPETSHFHTDLIVQRPDNEQNDWAYIYLLLQPNTSIEHIQSAITERMEEQAANSQRKPAPYLVPLTDIHLHSHLLRELEPNGNITYIYLIAGANILLFIIVLFNLWLNTGLIFSFNRKYYQLLRLNGASSMVVLRDESLVAVLLGLLSVLIGGEISFLLFPQLNLLSQLAFMDIVGISLLFLLIVVAISLLPAVTKMSSTLFKYENEEGQKVSGFTLSRVKYMLIAQYCIVMFVVIIGFGISKQMNLVKTSQVGGTDNSILVMNEQPEVVKERYDVLKNELLKYPEIEMVTSAMQLPGSAIRDVIRIRLEGQGEDDIRTIPLLVVGNDFLPFFGIKPIAGMGFQDMSRSYKDELTIFQCKYTDDIASNVTEEYLINRKALAELGFSSPEEAVGKTVQLVNHSGLDYINKGRIVGVTDDYNYTTTFEDSQPQLLMQRKMFQHCIMVHLSSTDMKKALATFNRVWNEVNPDYPADYSFLQDIYSKVYHNEIKAESLVRVFSLLCLIIANLGLIIITSFIIKRKTKEIGVRKVNGATPANIIQMLNSRFILWIGIAFVIAIPCAYLMMVRWLEHFSHRIRIEAEMYVLAGLLVLCISVISISWQSWKAATINPIKALKME